MAGRSVLSLPHGGNDRLHDVTGTEVCIQPYHRPGALAVVLAEVNAECDCAGVLGRPATDWPRLPCWTQPRLQGISLRSLQNWEIDRNLPRIDHAAKLARALGVSLDELAILDDEQERRGR